MSNLKLYDWGINQSGNLLSYDLTQDLMQLFTFPEPLQPFTLETLDYYANLLIIQYRNQPKAKATIQAIVKAFIADNIILNIRDAFNIDTAVGVQLDTLGKYIGVNRYYKIIDYPLAFGFSSYLEDEPTDQTGFADVSDFLTKDGTFLSASESVSKNAILNDDDYRILLKLKITQNYSNFSMKDINDSLYRFFEKQIYVIDNYDMTMTYYFDSAQSRLKVVIEAAIYKGVIPKPMGVKLLQPIAI